MANSSLAREMAAGGESKFQEMLRSGIRHLQHILPPTTATSIHFLVVVREWEFLSSQ